MIYVSSLEFQAGSCLYVTVAVKGGRPRACRTWSQRPKFVQGSLEPVPFLGAHTAYTCKLGEVFLGVSNEVWLHRFSSPPFGSPSHSFPFTHLLFPLFFHVLLPSCLVISSFSSFARTLVPALVCTCTSTYFQTQVSGRPGLYNEVGFIGCPCALGSPFISTTRFFVPSRPLVMSSFSCLLGAHTCTSALTLASRLPSGRRVCVTLGIIGILSDCFELLAGD